jgi:hypothetical protein
MNVEAIGFVRPVDMLDHRTIFRHRPRADGKAKTSDGDEAHGRNRQNANQYIASQSAHLAHPAAITDARWRCS